jgi:hypothetical protein
VKASRVSSDRRSSVRQRVVKIEQHGISHIVDPVSLTTMFIGPPLSANDCHKNRRRLRWNAC